MYLLTYVRLYQKRVVGLKSLKMKNRQGKNKRLVSQYKMKATGKAIFMYKYGQPTHIFSCIPSTFLHVQSKIYK